MAFRILEAGTPRRNLAGEFAERFTSGVMQGGHEVLSKAQQKQAEALKKGEREKELEQEDEALEAQGYKVKGIKSPEIRKQVIANTSAEQRENRKNEINQQFELRKAEKENKKARAPFEGALNSINKMKNLGKKGNLGFGLGMRKPFSKEARKDSSEYEILGKGLIQFISDIPIRNRTEFEVMAHDLYNPSKTDAEREGILDALQGKIENALRALSSGGNPGSSQEAPQQQERPPLQSFMR